MKIRKVNDSTRKKLSKPGRIGVDHLLQYEKFMKIKCENLQFLGQVVVYIIQVDLNGRPPLGKKIKTIQRQSDENRQQQLDNW
jgi:hypothetical protein